MRSSEKCRKSQKLNSGPTSISGSCSKFYILDMLASPLYTAFAARMTSSSESEPVAFFSLNALVMKSNFTASHHTFWCLCTASSSVLSVYIMAEFHHFKYLINSSNHEKIGIEWSPSFSESLKRDLLMQRRMTCTFLLSPSLSIPFLCPFFLPRLQ